MDPETASSIADLHQIIGLRNRLAHGYDEEVDDALVWRFSQEAVPALRDEVERLMPSID